MFILFGTRRSIRQLAVLTFVCGFCGNRAAQILSRVVTKFTLFFVPLFPVRTRHQVQCASCGAVGKVDRAQARQMEASAARPV